MMPAICFTIRTATNCAATLFRRNTSVEIQTIRAAGSNVKSPENQLVWPARVNPGINRGYRPEMLRDGKLKEFTAASSPFIYRGDLFPRSFTATLSSASQSGNLVRRNIDHRNQRHTRRAKRLRQIRISNLDRRTFRPVNLTTGPDGALYIVDFYRGVLQHRISLTSYLRKQSEDRGLDKPIHLGRIWRSFQKEKNRRQPAAHFQGNSRAMGRASLAFEQLVSSHRATFARGESEICRSFPL